MDIQFEWDPAKAEANLGKHGVSFTLARRVFADPMHMSEQDRVEGGELRWLTIGLVDGALLILVAHTIHDLEGGGEIVRIISARRATKRERRRYEQDG